MEINDEKTEMGKLEEEVLIFFDRHEDSPGVAKKYSREKNLRGWSRRSLLLVGLLCVVFGVSFLTAVYILKPEVKRPEIAADRIRLPVVSFEKEKKPTVPGAVQNKEAGEKQFESSTPREGRMTGSKPSIIIPRRGPDKKVVIIGGIEEGDKTPVEGQHQKVKRKIPAGDMKATEKIPEKAAVQEKPSRPISSDTAALDRKRGPMEAITREPLEPKREQPVASSIEEALPPGKPQTPITAPKAVRQPKQLNQTKDTQLVKQHGGKGDLKGEDSSIHPLAAAPKSSSSVKERIVQSTVPSLIATEEEVRRFFSDYVEKYEKKDIDGLLSLFSPKAIQNQRDGFEEIKRVYSDFFEKSRSLRYHMEDMRIETYQNMAKVQGRYELVQVSKKRGTRKTWKGNIRWVLGKEDGTLKILSLNFKHD